MTIKQQGGIFGRNPTFNDVETNDLTTSGSVNLDGPVTINGSGADADFRVEGDTDANLIWVDASRDKVGIGHNWGFDKNSKMRVEGPYLSSLSTSSVSAFSASGGGAVSTWIGGVGYSYGYIQAIQDDASMNLKQLWLNPLGGDVRVANGNLIIGTSGKGIDFSATSGTGTSELFDDYEEGTWGSVASGFSSATITANKYTKIGRMVYCTISLSSIVYTGTGAFCQVVLPFNENVADYFSVISTTDNATWNTVKVLDNVAFIHDGSTSYLQGNTVAAPTDITLSFAYEAT